MPLAGRNANLRATSLTTTLSTNSAATRSTGVGAANGSVQINDVTRRYWDDSSTAFPKLFRAALGSTAQIPTTDYYVNYIEGKFLWRTGDPSTGVYTVDTNYFTATQVAGGREWTINTEVELFEISEFGSSGWRTFQPNLTGAQATIGRYWSDSLFFDRVALSSKFVAEFVVNGTWKYAGFVRVTSDQVGTAVDSIVGETINLQVDGPLYFTT